jgi:hypothetical protein
MFWRWCSITRMRPLAVLIAFLTVTTAWAAGGGHGGSSGHGGSGHGGFGRGYGGFGYGYGRGYGGFGYGGYGYGRGYYGGYYPYGYGRYGYSRGYYGGYGYGRGLYHTVMTMDLGLATGRASTVTRPLPRTATQAQATLPRL